MKTNNLIYLTQLLLLSFPALLAGQSQALIFAVGEYRHLEQEPSTAIADAAALGAVLSARFGFYVEVVENPARADIEEKLEEYRLRQERDLSLSRGQLLLYFIGRGAEENGAGCFLPADADLNQLAATALPWHHLLAEIASIECSHILVVADAPHSSAINPDWNGQAPSGEARALPTGQHHGSLESRRDYITRIMLSLDAKDERGRREASLTRLFREGLDRGAEQTPEASVGWVAQYINQQAREAAAPYSFKGDNPYTTFVFYHQPGKQTEQTPGEDDSELWRLAQRQNTLEAYSFYLQLYPYGRYATEALRNIEQFPDTLTTADGRTWEAKPGPAYAAKDGFVLARGGTFTPEKIQRAAQSRGGASPEVTIRDFYLSPEEVTFDAYTRFCLATGRSTPNNPFWRSRGPVVNVDWYDAIEYCNWLSRQNGLKEVYTIQASETDPDPGNFNAGDEKRWAVAANWKANGYRLPTVAEWEYAACGPSGRSVKEARVSMGNRVQEWCWDWEAYGYRGEARKLFNPLGFPRGAYRALRGEAADTYDGQPCGYPGAGTPTLRHSSVGFRMVRNVW
ncbi:MAG: SUMF1/EgtB/PvdO family nonheme iron enzyme [Lewinellaceae bacterium]|nr:SUMF1/EgtB/PvdO family nonheme iron enzyme [Lewinellaceae bacterium]